MMITEEYLVSSRLFQRLKNGPHGQFVELYAARLVEDGLAGWPRHLAVPQRGRRSPRLDGKEPGQADQPR